MSPHGPNDGSTLPQNPCILSTTARRARTPDFASTASVIHERNDVERYWFDPGRIRVTDLSRAECPFGRSISRMGTTRRERCQIVVSCIAGGGIGAVLALLIVRPSSLVHNARAHHTNGNTHAPVHVRAYMQESALEEISLSIYFASVFSCCLIAIGTLMLWRAAPSRGEPIQRCARLRC
jgi:hypothetical protein